MSSALPARPAEAPLRTLAQAILSVEWLILLVMTALIWGPDLNRVLVLVLWLPVVAARLVLYRRPWRSTPLDVWFILLFALGLISVFSAPFQYGPYRLGGAWFSLPTEYSLIALGRPLLGLALVTGFTGMAARRGHIQRLLVVSAGLALVVGVLGLLSAQYSVKSLPMQAIIDALPVLHGFPGAEGGFNVNEIAGAMAWLAPLMAGLSLYFWRERQRETGRVAQALRVLAPAAFVLLWAALFLGQSRFAIFGVLPALAALVWLLLRGRARWIGLALVAGFSLLQVAIYFAPVSGSATAGRLEEHNEISSSSRLEMWASALAIIRDYPLTGAGINMYRADPVRERYPVPAYEGNILPHAHNEWMQAATDLGIPGLIVFTGFQLTCAWMLWRVWRRGGPRDRALALAIGAGLAAHAVYGLGDAITLWDRFAFVYWWMIGLAAAQYTLTFSPAPAPPPAVEDETG